jgi:peroxiredoxin
MKRSLIALSLILAAACTPSGGEATQDPSAKGAPTSKGTTAPAAASQAAAAPAAAATGVKVGQPAPDFTLTDLDGKTVHLADYKGKTVVLEWFNPGCPFVQKAHREGALKDMAARVTEKGVVWLAINSGAPGKQGHGKDTNVKARDEFGMKHPILLDETGATGRAYGAERTPHMYVIDPKGTVVYAGAIDSTRGGEPEKDEKVTNYVDVALGELAEGKTIATAQTEAYGCSVKY